jgi:hypothetical protein
MAEYLSDVTKFLNDMKAKQPELERRQREGRAIFWDKQLDWDELKRWQDARVRQQGYVYQNEPQREPKK